MKHAITYIFFGIATTACAARLYEWPQLPRGELPNTETVTNIALHVDAGRLAMFSLRLQTANCVSNEVLVAVGFDVDENGDLSPDETAFVFGCDCGKRYLADYTAGTVDDDVEDTLHIRGRFFDPDWNLARIVKRGGGEVGEVVTEMVENKYLSVILR